MTYNPSDEALGDGAKLILTLRSIPPARWAEAFRVLFSVMANHPELLDPPPPAARRAAVAYLEKEKKDD